MNVARWIAVAVGWTLIVGSLGCETTPKDGQQSSESANVDEASPSEGTQSAKTERKKLEIASNLPDVVDEALPSVVGLSTERVVESRPNNLPFRRFPFGPRGDRDRERRQRGMGSGVVIDEDGTILTNHHVVKGADKIQVNFANRRQKLSAEIVGTDEATDIAVLRLEDPPDDLQPISFGNSEDLRLGEPVVAIGNPFGLSGTVTYGIVSAKGRQNVGLAEYEDFIQTDAAINPGNSGGALVDMEGNLIGINTAILSRTGGSQGIGFAIPSSMAESVMTQLVDKGEVERGHLGVAIQTLSPELAEAFDVPKGTRGAVVSDVKQESPAAEAGLEQGDVIVGFDGDKVTSATDLKNRVAQTPPGTTVDVRILRDGEKQTLQVELVARAGAGGKLEFDRQGMLKGLVLGPLDQQAREEFNLPDRLDQGIVVLDIKRGSPAAQTGLRPGDVILEVNRQEVASVDQFTDAYEKADRRILLLVYRDGQTLFTAIPKVE